MSEAHKSNVRNDSVRKERVPSPANQSRLLRNKTEELLTKALRNDISKKDSRWIDDVYRLSVVNSRLPNAKKNGWLIGYAAIALICVVLAGLLMIFRVGDFPMIGFLSTNNISIHLRCKALTVTIAASPDPNIIGSDQHIVTDQLEISPLDMIAVSNTSLAFQEPGLNLRVSADRIYLESITLVPGATLKVTPLDGNIVLSTDTERLTANATFDRAEFAEPVRTTVRSKEKFDIPLFARFESLNEARSTLRIAFRQSGPVSMLTGKKITSLDLSDHDVIGADTLAYVSTVQSGSLILNDVSRTIDLHNRDALVLQGLQGWITDVTIEDGAVDLFVKGTARHIRAGPAGSGGELSPRLVEYFFKNQPFALFWGVMVFLWGVLRGVVTRISEH